MSVSMNIGKYKGKPLKEVILEDGGYIDWYLKNVEVVTQQDKKIKKILTKIDLTFNSILTYTNNRCGKKYDIRSPNILS